MSALVGASINVAKIPKDQLVDGKKGKYLNVTVSINDETDQYGNNAAIYVSQSQEEREAGKDRTYLGNGRVVWTDGNIKKYQDNNGQLDSSQDLSDMPDDVEDPLPF